MQARKLTSLLLVLSLSAAGCGAHAHLYPTQPLDSSLVLEQETTDPQPIVPDTSALPPEQPPRADDPRRYAILGEDQLQCLAASRSTAANLLLSERAAVLSQAGRHEQPAAETLAELLALQAVHERNRSAANALEMLLRLAEAEGGASNLDASLAEVSAILDEVKRLKAEGLPEPLPQPQLEEQRLELLHEKEETLLSIEKLNSRLAKLLGLDPEVTQHVWPGVDLKVVPPDHDVERSVHRALMARSDLDAMRLAARSLDQDTQLPARQLLGQIQPGLGAISPSHSKLPLIGHSDALGPVPARRDQLHTLLAQREQAIVQDVRLAFSTIGTRLRQIRQTDQKLAVLRSELAKLERQHANGEVSILAVRQARLEAIEAENELLHDVVEWKIAVVKWKEAQGVLAEECGYAGEGGLAACECYASPSLVRE